MPVVVNTIISDFSLSRIRRDASAFERYQHNRDLVSLLNVFADKERDLPPGWESKLDRNGKVRRRPDLWRCELMSSERIPNDQRHREHRSISVEPLTMA